MELASMVLRAVALLVTASTVWGFTPPYAVLNFTELAAAYFLGADTAWASGNIPLLDWPHAHDLVQAYYYRWRLFRKHVVTVNGGYAIDEFNPAAVGGRPISCSAGHHVAEGTWLRDAAVIDGVLDYWYHRAQPEAVYEYTNWIGTGLLGVGKG